MIGQLNSFFLIKGKRNAYYGEQMKPDLFRSTTRKYMELRHIRTREDLRKHTVVGSSTTFRKYWNNPELVPLGVFEDIMNALNVPYEERWEILKK